MPPETVAAGGAAGSAAYLLGVFGPAFIEVALARLRWPILPLRQQVVRGNDERSVLGILPVRQWISGNSESANQPDIKRRDTSPQCLNAIHEPEGLVHQLSPVVPQISERELASKGDIANGSARLDIRKCFGEQVSPPFRFHHQLGRQPQLEHGSEFGAPEPSQAWSAEGINVSRAQQVGEVIFAQFAEPGIDQ
ncbi:hypothetical protein ACFQXB_18690 [Plastorhodobacter daqingensis]|uniref:Uncharacterized protein n=1 Tax=Plastorhodobacter daqingensis TaxID=1387281 RepID=A0ABW2UQ14_9RHOB